MKSSGDLLRFVPNLDHRSLANYRMQYGLSAGKSKGKHLFPDRVVVELRIARPLILEGWKPENAFRKARETFDEAASRIREAILAFTEQRSGFGPTAQDLEARLSDLAPQLPYYLDALIESNTVARSRDGHLIAMTVFNPVGLPAYSPRTTLAFRVLSSDRRAQIRDVVLRKYVAETQDLPEHQRLPCPLAFVEREGIQVGRRNMPRGVSGFADPEGREIFLSAAIRVGSSKERTTLAHEYFHIFFQHRPGFCVDSDSDTEREAEATYAAVHYLVPVHTFDLAIQQDGQTALKDDDTIRELARRYAVTDDLIRWHLEEYVGTVDKWAYSH